MRKKALTILFALLICGTAIGQNMSASLCHNFTGNNIRAGMQFPAGRVLFEPGIKYHLNKPNYFDSRGYAYFQGGHAFHFIEHFGFYTITSYGFLKDSDDAGARLYAFYAIEFNNMGLKSTVVEQVGYDSTGNQLYKATPIETPAGFSCENNIGLGFRSSFSRNIAMTAEAGLGFIYMRDKSRVFTNPQTGQRILLLGGSDYDWPAVHFRFGLLYRLANK